MSFAPTSAIATEVIKNRARAIDGCFFSIPPIHQLCYTADSPCLLSIDSHIGDYRENDGVGKLLVRVGSRSLAEITAG